MLDVRADASIQGVWKDGPLGTRSWTYQWQNYYPQGSDLAWVHHSYPVVAGWKEGTVQNIGPYRVMVLQRDHFSRGWIVRRHSRLARLHYLAFRVHRAYERVTVRLVLTLHVWGLAEYNEQYIPQWSDVHLIRWLAGWWGRGVGK